VPLIRVLPRTLRLLSPTTKEDFPNKILKSLSRKLKNTRMLMRRSERELKPRMPSKATVFPSSTLSMMRSSRTNSKLPIRLPCKKKSRKLKNGSQQTKRLRLKNMRQSKRLLNQSSIPSCRRSMLLLVVPQEVCPEVCQEVCPEVCLEASQEELQEVPPEQDQAQVLMRLTDK
jgi:hypothetical protein